MIESSDQRGLLTKASPFGSVSETLERLRQALRE
jgi:hypothetical protein